jgi:8-oxo-dGTP diphosphatase
MNLLLPVYNYCPLCAAPVEIVPCEGRDRPVCKQCSHVIYVNPYPAACLVVLQEKRVLLALRSIEPQRGEWCLPGGFLEWGEAPEEGAARELIEETGIVAGELSLIGAYNSITGERRHVLLLAYMVNDWSGEPVAGDDAAEIRWVDLDSVPPLAFKVHDQVIADVQKMRLADAHSCD